MHRRLEERQYSLKRWKKEACRHADERGRLDRSDRTDVWTQLSDPFSKWISGSRGVELLFPVHPDQDGRGRFPRVPKCDLSRVSSWLCTAKLRQKLLEVTERWGASPPLQLTTCDHCLLAVTWFWRAGSSRKTFSKSNLRNIFLCSVGKITLQIQLVKILSYPFKYIVKKKSCKYRYKRNTL